MLAVRPLIRPAAFAHFIDSSAKLLIEPASDDSTPAAEFICGQIASADAAWHDGSEEFAQVMESCKADYPEGPAAELLSKMETAHEASLERNK